MRPGTWAWLFREPPCCGKRLSPGCSPENSGLKNTASLSQLKGPLTSTFSTLGQVTSPAQGPDLSAAVLRREPGARCAQRDSVAWPIGGGPTYRMTDARRGCQLTAGPVLGTVQSGAAGPLSSHLAAPSPCPPHPPTRAPRCSPPFPGICPEEPAKERLGWQPEPLGQHMGL